MFVRMVYTRGISAVIFTFKGTFTFIVPGALEILTNIHPLILIHSIAYLKPVAYL